MYHRPTFWLNSFLYVACLHLSVVLWSYMPERYPVHFDLFGNPTAWAERSPGLWILLVVVFTLSFLPAHLAQRFLFNDPDTTLINVPYKREFLKLPQERKVPVLRRTSRMLGVINTVVLLCWMAVLFLTFFTARSPGSLAAKAAHLGLIGSIVLVLVIVPVEVVLVRRMILRKLREEGLLSER